MFQVINIVSNAVDSVNTLPVHNQGNYTACLGVVLQLNSDYILNIVTQNLVGSSISGPYKISKCHILVTNQLEFTFTKMHTLLCIVIPYS